MCPPSLPQICAKSAAQPLSAFRLRLADRVLQAPAKDIKLANPAGSLSDTCATGPGWWLRGPELGALSEAPKVGAAHMLVVVGRGQARVPQQESPAPP